MSRSIFGSVKDKVSRKPSKLVPTPNNNIKTTATAHPVSNSPSRGTNSMDPSRDPEKHISADAPAIVVTDAPPAYSLCAPDGAPNSQPGLSATSARGSSPAPSLASVTSNDDKYAFLATFDTIFVIDDSGSMAGPSWREVEEVLRAVTPICTAHDKDGVDLYFLNHRSRERSSSASMPSGGYNGITSAAHLQSIFADTRPSRATPTGARLESILKPYVASLASARNAEDVKPVNIIVITDGRPTDDPESIIVHYAKKLDKLDAPPYQVGIQFFQVGSDRDASEALRELDDDLADQGIRDMVDAVTWDRQGSSRGKALSAEGILKVVLGAVVRRLDRKSTSGDRRSRT